MQAAQAQGSARPHLEIPGSQRLVYWAAFVAVVAILGALARLKTDPIVAVCALAIMGACLWACLRASLPGATYLTLDSESLTVSIRFAKKAIQWTDIKAIRIGWLGIETVQIPWNKQVFIDCSDRPNPVQIYPRMYGLSAEELVALITPYYEDARRQPAEHVAASAPVATPQV
jgi:Na+/H+-translocating membrane pyrophosphatase